MVGPQPRELPIFDWVNASSPAVSVEGLTIRYGDLLAVDNLSFEAHAGRITAVLGPNGAGKTRMIECCEGLREPAAGTVRVLGLHPKNDHKLLVNRIGVMLQDGGVYPTARVRETVELYAALHGTTVDVDELVRTCGLADRAKSTWRQLSGGERQRLSLALALTAQPEVAFLDEPTSGVDISGRGLIRDTLRKMANSGCAVVIATHELDEAERIADDVVIISKGRVMIAGTVNDLRSGDKVLRFRSQPGIDVAAVSASIGSAVVEVSPGEYCVAGESDASVIGALGSWLAEHGHPMTDVRTGTESLADIFLRVVGGESQ